MGIAISMQGVRRSFGAVRALDGVDLEVPEGTVTVILGPNGAGKTTTLRVITGAVARHSGDVRVFGLDPSRHGQAVRHQSGVVPPKPALYDRLSGRDNLNYAARLYELDRPPIDELAERFGIGSVLSQRVAGYSTGMRTRLALVRSLLHAPRLLLLDEPTAGLDPESAQAVRRLLFDLTSEGRTVVMSTHLLHEAEGTVDQLVMMDQGRVWESGTPTDLAARYSPGVRVLLDAEDRSSLANLDGRILASEANANGEVTVTIASLSDLPGLVEHLVGVGARLTRVEPEKVTLERLYFRMRSEEGPQR